MNRTVTVEVIGKVQRLLGAVATGKAALKDLGKEVDNLAKNHKEKFDKMTNTTKVAGLVLTGVFAAVVTASIAFDKQMSEVNATMDKSGLSTKQAAQQYNALRVAAIQAGRDTVFSATDAAKAEAELVKAGVSAKDVLGGGLRGALALASAGTLDLGDAAKYSAQAMNIFGLRGASVPHIADVFASAANSSAADVGTLAQALNQSGLVAHQYGLTLEQTAGTLALFAQNGLNGSDAGTSFKTMLQALNPQSDKTNATMKELGISFYDTQGKFIGITGVAGVLQAKLAGLTEQQRNAALAQIFGSDAVRAANVLYQQGAVGLQTWIDKTNDSGAAARTASAKLDNLSGDLEQLRGSLETVAIDSSGGATKGLRLLTQGATGLVNTVADLPTPLTETLTVLSGVGGVSLLAATGFVKARTAGKDFVETVSKMGPVGEKVAPKLGKIGGVLGKAGMWGAAALVAYEGIKVLSDYLASKSGPTARNVDALTDSFARFATTGKASGELAKTFGADLSGVAKDVAAIDKAAADVAQIQVNRQKTDYKSRVINRYAPIAEDTARRGADQANIDFSASDQSLANLANSGNALAARNGFDVLSQKMREAGKTPEEIAAQFKKYLVASAEVADANATTANSMLTVTTATGKVVIGLDEATSSGSKLVDVIDALSGANEDYGKANLDAEQALADLNKQLKDNDKNQVKGRKSLSQTTQAGRDNLKLIYSSIDADKKQFQTMYAKNLQTMDSKTALEKATDQYNTYIKKLRDTFVQEGFNADQVDALIKLYATIPPVETTEFKTPDLVTANNTASGYKRLMDQMDGRKVTTYFDTEGLLKANDTATGYKRLMDGMDNRTIETHFLSQFETKGTPPKSYYHGNRWGGVYQHAAEGVLRGAQITSAVSGPGARYAFSEGGTRREGFVPENGDYDRSMGILSTMAGWYGARIVAGGTRGGDGASLHYTSHLTVNTPRADRATLQHYQRLQEIELRVGRPR